MKPNTSHTQKLLTFLALCFLATASYAGSVDGTFKFDERKPYVALAYFADGPGSGPEICGQLNQTNKTFSSRLVVGKSGCSIDFLNSDVMNHNIFANDLKKNAQFDVGLIPPGEKANAVVNWAEGDVVRVGCKIHPQMRSYIANVPSRYYSIITMEDDALQYDFSLSGAPDSLQELVVWFPRMDPIKVTLPEGDKVTVDVTRSGKTYGTLTLSR